MDPPSQPFGSGQDPSQGQSPAPSPSSVTQPPNVSLPGPANPAPPHLQPSSSSHHRHHPLQPAHHSHSHPHTLPATHRIPSGGYQPQQHQHQREQQLLQPQQQQGPPLVLSSPPPHQGQQQAQHSRPPGMATLTPQHPDMYHLPAPHEMYHAPPPDHYRGPATVPHHHHSVHQPQSTQPAAHLTYAQHQPAPRQRTAIACRYCRRRKIRCSGFEASEDGRCSNCQRFQQECIFTPVSAQTQAFVPAHTLWRSSGQSPQLYGAYGQPLPAQHPPEQYAAQQHQVPLQPGYPANPNAPWPTSVAGYQPTAAVGPPPAHAYDDAGRDGNRKRLAGEPHSTALPPPKSALTATYPVMQGRPGEYAYPDPSALTSSSAVSPASSGSPHPAQQPVAAQPGQQPYYAAQPAAGPPAGRSSPQSSSPYVYDRTQSSASPHGHSAVSAGIPYPPPPSADAMNRADGRTPDSAGRQTSGGFGRPNIMIRDIVSEQGSSQGGRSAHDSNMLNALNRRPM